MLLCSGVAIPAVGDYHNTDDSRWQSPPRAGVGGASQPGLHCPLPHLKRGLVCGAAWKLVAYRSGPQCRTEAEAEAAAVEVEAVAVAVAAEGVGAEAEEAAAAARCPLPLERSPCPAPRSIIGTFKSSL